MREVMDRRVVRLLGGNLQPVELARAIAGCMEAEQRPSAAGPVAPNVFRLLLHPEDCADFRAADGQLERKLRDYTVELARERGFNFASAPVVQLVADAQIERGDFRVEGLFQEPREAAPRWGGSQRRRYSYSPSDGPAAARLEVPGAGPVAVDSLPYTIGRGPDNQLVLPDAAVSRRHAVLERAGERLRVRDLGSRNGTRVNGQDVSEAELCDGDVLGIGGFEATVRIAR